MDKRLRLILIASLLVGCFCIIFLLVSFLIFAPTNQVNNFNDCVKATGVVLESFPRQCIYNGKTYSE